MSTTRPLLEVIAMGPEDARAAERGGADRLELVREIGVGGLTPDVAVFAQIRAATKLPLRVMLRSNGGFTATEAEVAQLCHEAAALRREGADQFVLGFLDGAKLLDLGAIKALVAAIAPCPWTLHHAFDHAADQRAAWEAALTLPRVDHVLSGGIRGDLSAGLDLLCGRVDWQTPGLRWLGLELRAEKLLDADHGTVEFVARSKLAGRADRLHELSLFERVDGRWLYLRALDQSSRS